jgi:SAM-dependent methyltransferase
MTTDPRRFAPATFRNREPILAVLKRHLPLHGHVLEIASGTGEHVVHFANASGPGLTFQPSDPDPAERASIDAWVAVSGCRNVLPAIALDAASNVWPVIAADVVLCINMVHIAPWQAAVGLMQGAGRILTPGGLVFLYGPFRQGGRHTAPSNAAFDDSLRQQNPEWGVRDLEAVIELAEQNGFGPPEIVEMPANNLSVIFRRQEGQG